MLKDKPVYDGITDEQVEKLRWNIIDDFHAAEAAQTLLSHAEWCIASGQAMPEKLRGLLCDGIFELRFRDPLAAFGHIRPQRKKGRGRPRKESEYEWLHVLRDVLKLCDEQFPLAVPGERYPFMTVKGTAFYEYAKRTVMGNGVAVHKEARRIQSGFWEHVRKLPAAQIASLGLSEYLPRGNS